MIYVAAYGGYNTHELAPKKQKQWRPAIIGRKEIFPWNYIDGWSETDDVFQHASPRQQLSREGGWSYTETKSDYLFFRGPASPARDSRQ